MKIYILVEDTKKESRFEAEHGLSAYFEKDGKKFLFDLGQSGMFLRNAGKMGLDLSDVDYLIFSHGHYDHTGGLPALPKTSKLKIVAHPDCLLPKYHDKRYIGIPAGIDNKIFNLKDKPFKLTEHVWFLGEIPGNREKNLGNQVKDGIKSKDFLLDDSALVIIEENRLVIISGCAHSGIANIARYAKNLFPKKELTIIGGFHMLNHSDEQIQKTIKDLKKLNVIKVYPGHCTGNVAIKALLSIFKGERIHSGKVLEV